METEVPEENQEDSTSPDSDWDNRILCSDGNCIGVIGPDGHCKECGRKYEGELPEMSDSGDDEDAVEDEDEDTVEYEVESSATTTEATTEILEDEPDIDEDDDWANRVLCSDGNCIGVIGPDGKCKECGKPRE